TGYIEDVREFIWTSLVAVCPIRIGAGVQNKILECMACGVPVITTRIGNEGINAKDNYEISIAEKPDDYLKILIRLINSQSYRKSIASNARAFIEQRFQWDIILSKLNDPIVKESN
ncbi:MAG: glycosyltransferase, partial [Calditrichia bacterium]